MHKRIILCIISVCLLSVGAIYPQEADNDLFEFANKIMDLVKEKDFESTFQYFYVPDNYPDEKLQEDRKFITGIFNFFINIKLGEFSDYSSTDNRYPEQVLNIGIGAGELEKYKLFPVTMDVYYKVNFTKFGIGYIVLQTIKHNGKILIRDFQIGLPISNPKSLEIQKDFSIYANSI